MGRVCRCCFTFVIASYAVFFLKKYSESNLKVKANDKRDLGT